MDRKATFKKKTTVFPEVRSLSKYKSTSTIRLLRDFASLFCDGHT